MVRLYFYAKTSAMNWYCLVVVNHVYIIVGFYIFGFVRVCMSACVRASVRVCVLWSKKCKTRILNVRRQQMWGYSLNLDSLGCFIADILFNSQSTLAFNTWHLNLRWSCTLVPTIMFYVSLDNLFCNYINTV